MRSPNPLMRRAFDACSARWLTPTLVGGALLALLISLVLEQSESLQITQGVTIALGGAEITRLLSSNPLVWAYLVILVLHLLLRWVAAVAGDRGLPSLSGADKDRILADTWRYAIVLQPTEWQERAAGVFPDKSESVADESRAVYRIRPTTVPLRALQVGLLLLVAGIVLSTWVRESGTVEIGEGQTIQPSNPMLMSQYDWRFPGEPVGTIPFDSLTIDQGGIDIALNSRFEPVGGDIIKWPVSARFSYSAGDRVHRSVARVYPPAIVSGFLVQVIRIGIGPRIVVEQGSSMLGDSFTPLDIMPGRSGDASVSVEPLPYVLVLTPLPSVGVPVQESPYRLRLVQSGPEPSVTVASATVGPNTKPLEYDGWRISVVETRPWVTLSITRDPALLVMSAGLLLSLFGLLAWLAVCAKGWERWYFVEVTDAKETRLYVGVDAALPAHGRARARLEALLRKLDA